MAEAKAFKMIPHCAKDTITYEMEELVCCKDCKDACICSDDWVICTHIDSNGNDKHPVDWFCADGERKEEYFL